MKTPDEIKKGLKVCGYNAPCAECPYKDKKPGCNDKMLLDALAYIQQLEAQAPKWISAKEPPEIWKEDDGTLINYLMYMPEYGVDVGNYMKTAKIWVCMGFPCKVTHWMPLPEPPECKENGGIES